MKTDAQPQEDVSWAERDAARHAACSNAGVRNVADSIDIVY